MQTLWVLLVGGAALAAGQSTEERLAALEARMTALQGENAALSGQLSGLMSNRIHIPVDVYAHKFTQTTFECTVYREDQRAAVEAGCVWSSNQEQNLIDVFRGDRLRFLNGVEFYDRENEVWRLKDEAAFNNCDFTDATPLVLKSKFDALKVAGEAAAVELTEAGHWYLASGQRNMDGSFNTDDCKMRNKKMNVFAFEPATADKVDCPTKLAPESVATSGYVPVTRYVKRRGLASTHPCQGRTNSSYLDYSCRWGVDMDWDMQAYTGDYLAFLRSIVWSDYRQDIWQFESEDAFNACDFNRATRLVSDPELDAAEAEGKRFTFHLSEPGTYWFASERPGMEGNYYYEDLRRVFCWDPEVMGAFTQAKGAMSSRDMNWGEGVRLQVTVTDAPAAALSPCPAAAAASHAEEDSATIQKMKGVLAAVGRQLVEMQVKAEERVRNYGNSGVSMVRSQAQGTEAYQQETFVGHGGPAAAHNHADFKYTIGLGEFTAVLNGVHFTTRHNDFDFRHADDTATEAEHLAGFPPVSRLVDQPGVPPAVTNAGGMDAQVAEMREWFRAFQHQNVSHRDYRPYFKANLCYLEAAWVEQQDEVLEPFASERHSIDADSWEDMHEKMDYLLNSGLKSRLENLPFLPSAFRAMMKGEGSEYEPRAAQWFYRIQCQPLGRDVPTSRFRVARDFSTQMSRRGPPRTQEELARSDSARFEVNPTREAEYVEDAEWPQGRTTYEYMDELMAEVPGFNGPSAVLTDTSFGPTMKTGYDESVVLNTARYSRWYSMGADAMGQPRQKRGFNDNLYAAQTTHTKVSPSFACEAWGAADLNAFGSQADKDRTTECGTYRDLASCSAHRWGTDEVDGGALEARCVWSGSWCNYKKCWETRWSYAIPLEVVYTSPLNTWNPHNIAYHEPGTPEFEAVNDGRDGSAAKPYRGNRFNRYFHTPESFFTDRNDVDPADTSGGVFHVEGGSGAHPVRASGHYINFPPIAGVGTVRQRYPVMPIHEEGNTIWKEAKALQEMVLGQEENQRLKRVMKEARALEYGVDLYLYHSSHSHTVHVTAAEFRQLVQGKRDMVQKTSSGANQHGHYVGVAYDSDSVGDEWRLVFCSSRPHHVQCPANVFSTGQCQPFNDGTSHTCCPGICPDDGVLLW